MLLLSRRLLMAVNMPLKLQLQPRHQAMALAGTVLFLMRGYSSSTKQGSRSNSSSGRLNKGSK
jgi:hypothetical protein